jgi:hypothetical protein
LEQQPTWWAHTHLDIRPIDLHHTGIVNFLFLCVEIRAITNVDEGLKNPGISCRFHAAG